MLNFSNGLCLAIIGSGGFCAVMDGGVIRVFDGPRPESANHPIPPGNNQIATVTTEGRIFVPGADTVGAGLRFRLGGGVIIENFGRWDLMPTQTGIASWFRWNWRDPDLNDYSAYFPRIDGDVGILTDIGVDMVLDTPQLVEDQRVIFDLFLASF